MSDTQLSSELAQVVGRIRDRISKHRADKGFNEQNTKASLVVPVLQVLGWDTNDSDEVHWEYKPRPRYNPVDFALMLQRTPCLFLEAKALRENLGTDKLTLQILTYASASGVQWVVLTNGDEYRIYNAGAPVPAEEKLFRSVTISKDSEATLLGTLSLLSKRDLQDKKIARLWEANFVDRQVENAIEQLFSPDDPAKALVRAVRKLANDKLKDGEIRASLRRARIHLDFPPEPEAAVHEEPVPRPEGRGGRRKRSSTPRSDATALKTSVTLAAIVAEGLLRPPIRLTAKYRGQNLSATIQADGAILFQGTRCTSPSVAAGMARKPFYKGARPERFPPTNGWTFWQVQDPASNEMVALDTLRGRYLRRKKTEAERFGGSGA